MKKEDWFWLGVLGAMAVFIWHRDLTWLGEAGEVVPIIAALPLFVWLGAPWRLRNDRFALHSGSLLVAGASFVLGVALNLTLLLAVAWTAALWSWIRSRVSAEKDCVMRLRRLLPLPLLAFPWITLDGGQVGWWFRLSAAWAVEHLFAVIGFAVSREGTHLIVESQPVSVDASCAGLKVLQCMLIAGTMLAFIQLGRRRQYWWTLPLLPLLAWTANTVRVTTLTVAALSFGPEFAQGWFHAWGGWLVLVLMFALCWICFSICDWFKTSASTPA